MKKLIKDSLEQARATLDAFIADPSSIESIEQAAQVLSQTLSSGGKIICCGNGGSLCDATHFAEELSGRYRKSRRPLAAIAVNDAAYMTCVGNDYSFDQIFVRYVEAFAQKGDALLAISTSGTSENILKAVRLAAESGVKVVALTSTGAEELVKLSDAAVCAPRTPYADRIQEIHIKVIHILIQSIENNLGFES